MRTSIIVHLARSFIAAAVAVIAGMFVPHFTPSVTLGGTKILEITQHIIDYLPSSNMYRIGVGAYVAVISFFSYRASRHLTLLGTVLWAALWGAYIGVVALPNLEFFPANAWAHAEAVEFLHVSADSDLIITIVVAIIALIGVPVMTGALLAQIPFLRASVDASRSGPTRVEPEI